MTAGITLRRRIRNAYAALYCTSKSLEREINEKTELKFFERLFIAVRVEKHLEGLLARLTTLFSGFLSNASEQAAFLNVSCNHLRTYPNFKDMTVDLLTGNCQESMRAVTLP